jgi:hypothetical protein
MVAGPAATAAPQAPLAATPQEDPAGFDEIIDTGRP